MATPTYFNIIAAVAFVAGGVLWIRRLRKARETPSIESQFIVRLSDDEVSCESPDGQIERLAWSDLQKFEVLTTSDGPWAPDVFWILHGSAGCCVIPQGATGHKAVLDRLFTLPGFDSATFIDAMGCTSDKRFQCWQRTLGTNQ